MVDTYISTKLSISKKFFQARNVLSTKLRAKWLNAKLTLLAIRLAYNTVFFDYFSRILPIQHVFIIQKIIILQFILTIDLNLIGSLPRFAFFDIFTSEQKDHNNFGGILLCNKATSNKGQNTSEVQDTCRFRIPT